EGTNILTGDNALAFVRQRHGLPGGDYARIERQQSFLAAVFRSVKSTDTLTSPGKLAGFLNAVTRATLVDSETDLTDLAVLAERVAEGGGRGEGGRLGDRPDRPEGAGRADAGHERRPGAVHDGPAHRRHRRRRGRVLRPLRPGDGAFLLQTDRQRGCHRRARR